MGKILNKHVFQIAEPADNAGLVYTTRQLLDKAGFDIPCQYLIASAVSELSTNILRYAQSGTVSIAIGTENQQLYVEIDAVDNGPGIDDIAMALKENYSTGGGLGLGLPSVKRIMDEFEIQSKAGKGTTIKTRKWLT